MSTNNTECPHCGQWHHEQHGDSELVFTATPDGYSVHRYIQSHKFLIGKVVRGDWMPMETFSMSSADMLMVVKAMRPLGLG